ncbi:hypothetical protein HDU87_006863 [Geranomyces variabilis]|uniref:Uncharacterized protein n=1 Tax=Geranomyces variabilis TaxID=109894 RepID=A0AAD5TQ17_9FUNG|nr:hypothetical protein HDU87_006863 [Geranomyces variabilis]
MTEIKKTTAPPAYEEDQPLLGNPANAKPTPPTTTANPPAPIAVHYMQPVPVVMVDSRQPIWTKSTAARLAQLF